jgi:chromosomal replication initiation ATPase DnaA
MERDDFLVGAANYEAIALIDRWPDWPVKTVYLSGAPGTGKTHLAEIWRTASGAAAILAADLSESSVEALVGHGAVAIEDVDAAPFDERALFHLLNRAGERGVAVLVSGREPAASLTVGLADLASRLRAAQRLRLAEPDDLLLKRVLIKLFADRQLAVPPAVIAYIVARLERSFAAANRIVELLDRAALAEGRAVSRRLAEAALGLLVAEGDQGHEPSG